MLKTFLFWKKEKYPTIVKRCGKEVNHQIPRDNQKSQGNDENEKQNDNGNERRRRRVSPSHKLIVQFPEKISVHLIIRIQNETILENLKREDSLGSGRIFHNVNLLDLV